MLLKSVRGAAQSYRHLYPFSLSLFAPKMASFSSSAEAGPSSRPMPSLANVHLPELKGMKELDRSAFDVPIQVMSIRVPSGKIHGMMKHPLLRQYTLDIGKIKAIAPDPDDPNARLIRLRVPSQELLPDELQKLIRDECRGTSSESLVIGYDSWSSSEILNSILPRGGDDEFAPSSFTQTGHIGHVNLREEWLPYKYLIAQVLLDKNATLRTIVNKLDQINAQFRFFDMEVLAGDPDMLTTVSESTCSFTFDFSKVYWNSRLQHEHERLIALIPPGQNVADVMAGVGPFAVPLAKKGCYVLGNDLNPESVKWMRKNQEINKVQSTLRVEEMDGRDFIRQSASTFWRDPFPPYRSTTNKEKRSHRRTQDPSTKSSPARPRSPPRAVTQEAARPQVLQHFIMNLPDSALTFLDAFWGLYTPLANEPGLRVAVDQAGLPLIHVYCFTKELDPAEAERDVCQRATSFLGHSVSPTMDGYNLHLVRRVAPKKDMYCLTFRLRSEVVFATDPHPTTIPEDLEGK